jgi:hypothetical protein
LLGVAVASALDAAASSVKERRSNMRVKIDEVPLEIRRRAARQLDAVRGAPIASGADAAQLGVQSSDCGGGS